MSIGSYLLTCSFESNCNIMSILNFYEKSHVNKKKKNYETL